MQLAKCPDSRTGLIRCVQSRSLPSCSPSIRPASLHQKPALRAIGEYGNCITEATTKSIVTAAVPDHGGVSSGGSVPNGGGKGGSGGSDGGSEGKGDGGKGHPMQLWTYLFAAIMAVGGTMGYVKKGSSKSLGGGLSVALVMALAAQSMSSSPGGAQVAFAVSLLMGVFFLSRFVRSKKVMPGGVGAGMSLGLAAGYLLTGI